LAKTRAKICGLGLLFGPPCSQDSNVRNKAVSTNPFSPPLTPLPPKKKSRICVNYIMALGVPGEGENCSICSILATLLGL